MTQLKVSLHPAQIDIYNSKARYKIIAAGRRFGKTRLACLTLLIKGLQGNKPIFYVAPTFQQAKDVIWTMLKELGHEVIKKSLENTGVVELINGNTIHLKGSDRPDTLRGVGLYYVVIDEYADMKEDVWEQILRPALSDVKGGALFIGTPRGRNHFYHLFQSAVDKEDWETWQYTSYDNPFLDPAEIDSAKSEMSSFSFRQEYMASFEAAASDIFNPDWIKYDENEPKEGEYVIAADLAGFEAVAEQSKNKRKHLDQTAIAIVKVHPGGWWVKDVLYGRWDIRETAIRLLKAARDHNTKVIGLEKGALKNAITPYLREMMARNRYFCVLPELTHGNRKKTDRIVWSLQGRFEHGRIVFNKGRWNQDMVDQLMQFPDDKTHDDLVDALSYVDQLAVYNPYVNYDERDSYDMMDESIGY